MPTSLLGNGMSLVFAVFESSPTGMLLISYVTTPNYAWLSGHWRKLQISGHCPRQVSGVIASYWICLQARADSGTTFAAPEGVVVEPLPQQPHSFGITLDAASVWTGVSLPAFSAVSVADVMTAIAKLPDKSSAADPLPVPLMKQVASELGPFMCELFNRSMSAGHFPATFKEVFITPVLSLIHI